MLFIFFNNKKPEWLNPGIIPEQLWDYKICSSNDKNTLLQELLIKAYDKPLTQEESEVFRHIYIFFFYIFILLFRPLKMKLSL